MDTTQPANTPKLARRNAYVVTFTDGRIGRRRHVEPLTVTVVEDDDRAQDIARHVYFYARPKLISSELNVAIEMDDKIPGTGKGWITAGFNTAGEFTIAPATEE
jgi:hypothetical protein